MTNELSFLTEPVTKLIEAVRSATGIIYEPTRIKRKAKADADALIIKTEGEIKAFELAKRAAARISFLELRRQRNIEAITESAFKFLPDSVDDSQINDDWLIQFFRLAQDIGDEEVQSLWAKILAGEVARTGSFSLRTIQTLQTLSQKDAKLFELLSNYLFHISKEIQQDAHDITLKNPTERKRIVDNATEIISKPKYILFLFRDVVNFLKSKNVTADELLQLKNLGLLNHSEEEFIVGNGRKLYMTISKIDFTLEDMYSVKTASRYNFISLSSIGYELVKICQTTLDEEFIDVVRKEAEFHFQTLKKERQ